MNIWYAIVPRYETYCVQNLDEQGESSLRKVPVIERLHKLVMNLFYVHVMLKWYYKWKCLSENIILVLQCTAIIIKTWQMFVGVKGALNSNYKPTKHYPSIFESYLVIYIHLLTSHNICNRQFKMLFLAPPKHYNRNI